jgi:hypothetical protein
MSRLYILEQKIATLEIIIESLVEELINNEIVNRDGLDKKILDRIRELGNQVKEQEIEVELLNFPYWGEKGEA